MYKHIRDQLDGERMFTATAKSASKLILLSFHTNKQCHYISKILLYIPPKEPVEGKTTHPGHQLMSLNAPRNKD